VTSGCQLRQVLGSFAARYVPLGFSVEGVQTTSVRHAARAFAVCNDDSLCFDCFVKVACGEEGN
jgi:hypothetical protein